jgi:hypothetical protein
MGMAVIRKRRVRARAMDAPQVPAKKRRNPSVAALRDET